MKEPELPFDSVPTRELLALGLEEAKELARTEIKLARAEARRDLVEAARAGVLLGVAATLVILSLAMLLLVLVLTVARPVTAAALLAAILLAVGALVAVVGYRALPRPLEHTQERLLGDAELLKEHVS